MSTFELKVTGGASLGVRRATIHEAISDLFTVSVVARSRAADIDLEPIVGHEASLQVTPDAAGGQSARAWSGIVRSAQLQQAEPTGVSTYELVIVPKLWLLTQRTGHRVYQHLSIPDIVDELLAEWSIEPSWEIDRRSYPRLEYKVQWGETDYAFLSRLLEEAGIAFYFLEGGATGTTLTLGDKLQAGLPRPGPALPFVDNPNEAGKEYVEKVQLGHEVRPGAATLRDDDFRNPPFRTGEARKAPAPESAYEHYAYRSGAFLVGVQGTEQPVADDKGTYVKDEGYGNDLAARVLASLRADKRRARFQTNVVDLWPGRVFSIDGHPHPELANKLLVTSFSFEGEVDQAWRISGEAVFADARAPYRPPRRTPKPACHGVQSARVVGPQGQEIHTDEFGRVRVQFPWDREGKGDDDSSCWMRVSQGWAGAGYGTFAVPRVGQEVLVAFLDGDPDAPIVAGRVHNAQAPVPYKLPDNKTVSTWRSASSPGGDGYNEIKYEDKAGKELVYVQAQRDHNQLVKRDEVARTKRNKLTTVEGTLDLVVKGARRQLVEDADHLHVKKDWAAKVDGALSLTVGGDQQEKVSGNHALDAAQAIHVKAGQTLVLEAGSRLTIKGPGGFIDIHPGGVDIVGDLVNINSGGSAGSGAGSSPKAPDDAAEAQPKDTPAD